MLRFFPGFTDCGRLTVLPDLKRDLNNPRPDEAFDEMRLATYLAGKLPGADQEMSVQQFSGGMANLTYLLTFGDSHEYVFRRPPLGTYAPSAHDMSRENKVLSVLSQVFPYAPRIYLYVEEESVVGAPFLIMERRKGTVVRRKIPHNFGGITDGPRLISEALVDVLVEFHQVDYAEIGLADLGRPKDFVTRQMEGWYRRWHAAKLDDNPVVEQVYHWLADHLPASSDATLVHNDYKLDNTVFADDDPSSLVAVLDWDMCTLGDPLLDLGTLLTYWTEPSDPPHLRLQTPMPTGVNTFLKRRQLVERYARQSGRDVSDIRFYHVLGLFRWLVVLQQIYVRYVRGTTKDKRFAPLGESVKQLAQVALLASLGGFE